MTRDADSAELRNQAIVVGSQDQWFVETDGGLQAGPYSAAEFAQQLEQGTLSWTTQVWRKGLKNWRAARRDDVLVMAVASVRGMSVDTRRIDALGTWAQGDDTVFDPSLDVAGAEDAEEEGATAEHVPMSPPWRGDRSGATRLPAVRLALAGLRHDEPERRADALPSLAVQPDASATTPARQRWTARLSTLLIAILAFGAGALFTSLSEPSVEPAEATSAVAPANDPQASRSARAPDVHHAAAVPSLAPQREPATSPGAAPSDAAREGKAEQSVEIVTRSLPAENEILAQLARVTASVRRCVRRADHVDIELAFEGTTGFVRDVSVRTPLRKERAACVARVLHALTVVPFVSKEFRLRHRYAF